jgi:hypothetical protein
MISFLKGLIRRPTPPPPVRIAGIYTIAHRLALPACTEPRNPMQQIIVAMTSGRDAVYLYAGFERAWNVDWGWHTFRFHYYLDDPRDLDFLPRYS